MRQKPVKISSLEGLFYTRLKLSQRLELGDTLAADENKYLQAPITLNALIVNEDGSPAKSIEEWDEWCDENMQDAHAAVQEARSFYGSVAEAQKK